MNDCGHRFARANEARAATPGLAAIVDLVCKIADRTPTELAGVSRAPAIVSARRACAVLMRDLPTKYTHTWSPSFPEMARVLGLPTHATSIDLYYSAYRDQGALKLIDLACEALGVPASERPVARTPDMPRLPRNGRHSPRPAQPLQHRERAILRKRREERKQADLALQLKLENNAHRLLSRLCEYYGLERTEIAGHCRKARARLARAVFACIVLDTDACGRVVTLQAAAEICGRKFYASAREWRASGRARPAEVARACAWLGVAPPSYARKEMVA